MYVCMQATYFVFPRNIFKYSDTLAEFVYESNLISLQLEARDPCICVTVYLILFCLYLIFFWKTEKSNVCFSSLQIFSIIVFACVSSQGWIEGQCLYNNDRNACGFGTAIGVLAFLGLLALLVIDAMFDNISSIQHRKWAVLGDMGFSGEGVLKKKSAVLSWVSWCFISHATWMFVQQYE